METKVTTALERLLIAKEKHQITSVDLVQRVATDENMSVTDALRLVNRFEDGNGCHVDVAAALIRIIVDRQIAQASALEAWGLVEKLRAPEGHFVTLICDNHDFNGQPNSAVEVCGDWTKWCPRRFTGDTVLEALRAAAKTQDKRGSGND